MALVVLVTWFYRRQQPKTKRRMQLAITGLAVAGLLARIIWLVLIGHFSWIDLLPLHLCTLSVLTEFVVVLTGSKILKEFSYALSMPGALAAILTPAWGIYPLFSYMYLQLALEHTLVVLLPVIWVWGDHFRPSIRRLPACTGLLLILAGFSILTNELKGTNFMFLSFAPANTPLEIFEHWWGNPGYLAGLIAMLLVVWAILYIPWMIIDHREKQKKVRS